MTLTTYLPVPAFNVLKFIVISYVWGTTHTKLFDLIENYMVNKEFTGGNAVRIGNRFSLRDRKTPIVSGMLGRTMLIAYVVGFAAIELAFEFSTDGTLISETNSIRLKVLEVTDRKLDNYKYFGDAFNARLREDMILGRCVKVNEMVYYPTEILRELVEKSERNSGVFCPSNYTEGEKVDEYEDVGPDEFKKFVKRVKAKESTSSGRYEVATGVVMRATMMLSQKRKAGGLLSTFQDFFTARIEGSSATLTYRKVSFSPRMGYIVDGNITHFGKASVREAEQRLGATFSVVSTLRVEKAESDRIIVLDYEDKETDGDVRRLKYLRLAAKSVGRIGSNMEEKEIDIAVKVGDRVVATVERWAVIILVTLTVVNLLCMLLIKSVSRGADILDVNDWGGGYVKWLSEKLQLQGCGSNEQYGVFVILENNGAFQHVTVSNADLSVKRDSSKELKGTDPRAIRSQWRCF